MLWLNLTACSLTVIVRGVQFTSCHACTLLEETVSTFAELLESLNRHEPALLDEVQALILDTKGVPLSVRRDALFGVTALALAHRQQRSPSIQALVSTGSTSFLAVVLDQVVKWLLKQVWPCSLPALGFSGPQSPVLNLTVFLSFSCRV